MKLLFFILVRRTTLLMNDKMIVVIMGPPGCGKGTQSFKISERYGLKHLSTGEIIRNEIKEESEIGKEVAEIISRGEFVSDEIANKLVDKELKKTKRCILDGYPRTLAQAERFKDQVDLVILIDLDERTSIERICHRNEGRPDDNEEIAKKRWDIYVNTTSPIIDFYSNKGILKKIDGTLSVEQVFKNIVYVLEPYLIK